MEQRPNNFDAYNAARKRIVQPGMKWCARCKSEKPLASFPGRKRKDSYCTTCKYAYSKQHAPATNAEERFWPKVDKNGPGGCWIWTGAKNTRGYGQLWIGGTGRLILAHRLSLILAGREVPPPGRDIKNGVIDHICKVHACVNPAHLRVVTQRVNTLENSLSPYALNSKKTHCSPGNHPFAGDNVYYTIVDGSLRRTCLACLRKKGRGLRLQPNTPETAHVVKSRDAA